MELNNTILYRVDCGLQTMQAIDFLSRTVQEISNRGLLVDVMLLQAIDADCANFYKSVQRHLIQTKTKSNDSRLIYLPIPKRITIKNSTQFSYWLHRVDSNLDESTSFDGFTPFSYVLREEEVHSSHVGLSPGITFTNRCKAVVRLYGNHFDEDNRRFYASLRVEVFSCGISYCDQHEKKKDGCAAWKNLVEYYYGFINDEKKIKNIKKKIRRASYFKEEEGFNYE